MVTWSIGMPNFCHLANQTPNSKSQIFSDMLQCHSINRIALYHVGKFFIVFLFTQWALSLSNFFLHTLSFSISLPLSLLSLPCSPLSGHPLCLPHQPNLGRKPSLSLEAHLSHCLKPLCRTTDLNPPPLV